MTTMTPVKTTDTAVRYNGRVYTVTTYVDPYPGMKGNDRITVRQTCTRCGGTGIYVWWTALGEARGTCFLCLGACVTMHSRAVSMLRREAKVEAVWREYGDAIRAEYAAEAEAVRVAELAAEFAEHWDAAHAEQARRAAMVTGFVADIGAKVDVTGAVTVATSFDVPSYRGYGADDRKALVVVTLDDGHVVKATGTGRSLFDIERGARVRIRGTVKDHDNYRGQDQTVLTRAKIDPVEWGDVA